MMVAGRPTDYSEELIARICTRLAQGESLRAICRSDDIPDISTIMRWLSDGEHKEFNKQYARAREVQADVLADEIIDIADTPQEGTKVKETTDGIEIVRGDMIDHRRLRVDARKWFASKVAPKKYGDRITNAIEGGDPSKPVKMDFTLTFGVSENDSSELEKT